MSRADISSIVQSILVEHFSVIANPEMWSKTLENLNKDLRFLGFLLDLEELLQSQISTKILLVEHISAIIHTPEDIVTLIFETIEDLKKE